MEYFEVNIGVQQCCVLSPTFFFSHNVNDLTNEIKTFAAGCRKRYYGSNVVCKQYGFNSCK